MAPIWRECARRTGRAAAQVVTDGRSKSLFSDDIDVSDRYKRAQKATFPIPCRISVLSRLIVNLSLVARME